MPHVEKFTFEVTPEGVDPMHGLTAEELAAMVFEPFVLEVPTLNGPEAAARRAWWSAFHMLGARGLEPEEFEVHEFENDVRGRRVTMGGFVELVELETPAEELGRLRRELSELDHEMPEYRDTLDRIAVLVREAATRRREERRDGVTA